MSTCGREHSGATGTSGSVAGTAKRRRGGTIINIITGIIFFGLIGLGIWWVIKTMGQAGEQYTTGMIRTSNKASTVACQANFRAIGQNLQMCAISNGSFPATQKELMDFSGYTRLFRCPDPNGSDYVYVPGQTGDMPSTNVVLYETEPVHDGRCNVLFLGGQIALLTPEELRQALEATTARRR